MRKPQPTAEWPSPWHILRQFGGPLSLGVALAGVWLDVNPCLAAAPTPPPPEVAEATDAPASEPRRLELGVGAGGIVRPSDRDDVDYGVGLRWSGHGTVVLLEQLGVRLTGGMEYHELTIERGGLGADGAALGKPSMRGPFVMGQLQPMLEIAPRFDAFGLFGIGWQRFTAAPIDVGEPSPLTINERSGVVVELPLALGARYAVVRERIALSLSFAFAIPLTQSGALFNAQAGASQSLRQDTGELVRVDALPRFGSAPSASLSVDLFF